MLPETQSIETEIKNGRLRAINIAVEGYEPIETTAEEAA